MLGHMVFSRPGKQVDNTCSKSRNRKISDECLNIKRIMSFYNAMLVIGKLG